MLPDEIVKRVKKALKRAGDTHTWDDVCEGLRSGRFQIFYNDHGCSITEIIGYPRKRVLNCWITAGELPGVMDLQKDVDAFARANGIKEQCTTARKGWLSVLPAHGWKSDMIVFTREVPPYEYEHV